MVWRAHSWWLYKPHGSLFVADIGSTDM